MLPTAESLPPPTPFHHAAEADRDGDGEVNEEEFFRCGVGRGGLGAAPSCATELSACPALAVGLHSPHS